MAVVTLTTALTLSGLIVKIKLLRRKVKDTDSKVTAMLDQVVDILEQFKKMEDEGVCLRSHEIEENIRTIHELRDELEQYMTRTMVGKAFRQSKTETCLIDLDLTLESLVKTHGDMCGLNGIEVMRRISLITQSICVALEEEKISTHRIDGDQIDAFSADYWCFCVRKNGKAVFPTIIYPPSVRTDFQSSHCRHTGSSAEMYCQSSHRLAPTASSEGILAKSLRHLTGQHHAMAIRVGVSHSLPPHELPPLVPCQRACQRTSKEFQEAQEPTTTTPGRTPSQAWITVHAALCALIRANLANFSAFEALEGVEVIVYIVGTGTEEEIVAACRALRYLLNWFPQARSSVGLSGGLVALTQVPGQGTVREQEEAKKALRCLGKS
ncbi:hypothetical protein Poli38472_004764 [Pythium oligandrum]|uniref:Uncharacterized protein n=1 Tax=Pythium oligandrum TaxID=41045 RepID=A0A8K1CAU3_PYTOL|nr:hypothetical protein Poli38472_004764 [Pythium oligandrum]|eukprot:TMW59695.1 hypothetical protein Poli38472_004764 [Pythium oligandrum]